ncbi:FixH family protein [Marinobacterium aestuariivivens]|uniref:FixH family protein n=1 Tax=Marinobacterium aestuariivivens TaxID=1698799 RepID=A0ABW2A861_9GAMM
MKQDSPAIAPWYKQPWLWFILAPVIASMIYGTTFLYLSIVSADGVVKDDYYKVARGLEIDNSRSERARALDLAGSLLIDEVTGDIGLTLNGTLSDDLAELEMDIIHPTHKKYDQKVRLRRLDGSNRYSGNLQSQLGSAKRYLVIQPLDQEWTLRAEVLPPMTR